LVADKLIIDAMNAVVEKHVRRGFWKCFYRIRHLWNHKRVWRVYRQKRLNLKSLTKKRLPERTPAPLDILLNWITPGHLTLWETICTQTNYIAHGIFWLRVCVRPWILWSIHRLQPSVCFARLWRFLRNLVSQKRYGSLKGAKWPRQHNVIEHRSYNIATARVINTNSQNWRGVRICNIPDSKIQKHLFLRLGTSLNLRPGRMR